MRSLTCEATQKRAGMRDKMIHEYFGVNLELVWSVVERDLPGLERAVDALLADAGNRRARE
jgi:uncharacterized protein with HEPN domain